ncbi:hypothetical protein QBC38DRAFT_461844 [Podospora fimiseda]|uniref:Uncharacterized protein n=1 Tax=Podospora fimiseda TaxID=252190 RepID=A0AAN7BGG0_9PEZI|nr:hypothetical protein QBC38DRAFT_461844 [Podospora fimiseda]
MPPTMAKFPYRFPKTPRVIGQEQQDESSGPSKKQDEPKDEVKDSPLYHWEEIHHSLGLSHQNPDTKTLSRVMTNLIKFHMSMGFPFEEILGERAEAMKFVDRGPPLTCNLGTLMTRDFQEWQWRVKCFQEMVQLIKWYQRVAEGRRVLEEEEEGFVVLGDDSMKLPENKNGKRV